MATLNVEFFHDVICSFCYPMSYRMREISKAVPELNIIHRSFALAQSSDDLVMMFGSHEGAKKEIMNHWEHANENDTLHRFNIEGMKQESFLFPTSLVPLTAAKAAYLVGGDDLYWDAFDALQKGLFTDTRDVSNVEVVKDIIKTVNLDFDLWLKYFESGEALNAVEADFERVKTYGIRSVPSLVVEGKYLINGALDENYLIEVLKKKLAEKEQEHHLELVEEGPGGNACNFENGKWNCD
ncbi:DsbA family protein [Erysipelothrix sp. HDW6B]|uniref:DsbA family oxidoreductase n=1 Tax=Erysipelothrix TaxID=1647 RepID=UPI00135C7741|nr:MULTISPECIES: DsbA family protein [Erysipelothrix]QIK85505.1 DsbA family protein [Erysipelothrix sp. HDW6B]